MAIVLGVLAFPCAVAARSYGSGDTGVVDVTNTSSYSETEPSLSVDPANPNLLIAGENRWEPLIPGLPVVGADGVVDTSLFSSQDGGRTWTGQRLGANGITLPDPLAKILPWLPTEFDDVGNVVTADQDTAWNRHGQVCYEDLRLLEVQVLVWCSSDGGRSWSGPSEAVSELRTGIHIDRPWLTIDNTGGPHDGTVYLTWETMFYQPYLPEVFERSSIDGGRSWGPIVRVDRGLQRTQWDPRQATAVGAGGVLYDVYDVAPFQPPAGPQLAPISLELARSADGGKSFEHFTVDSHVHRVSDPDEAEPYFTETISALAADRRHAGRAAVVWPEATSSGNSRIMLRYTLNGGRSWSPRIDVADDPASTPDQHDHVAVDYLPDGRLVVGWRDRRCCGGGWYDPFEVFARVFNVDSTGHLTRGRTVQFTDGPQQHIFLQRGGVAPDEYLGMAVSSAGVAMDWSALGARGIPDIYFRRVPLSAFTSR